MWSDFAGVVVGVRDLASAEQAYASLLGLRPAWSGAAAEAGCISSGFGLANAFLELRTPAGEGANARWLRHRIESRGEGVVAIALAADDVAGCARWLRGRGIHAAAPEPAPTRGQGSALARALEIPESATRGIPVFVVESANLLPRSEPADPGSVGALDHVVVASRDLEASGAVFGETLALRLALDRRFEARGLRILFFRLAGVTLEVTGPLVTASDAGSRDSFFGLAWRVRDVRAARERVSAAGFDASELRAGHKPGTLVCTVRSGTRGVATLLIGPA